MIRWRRRLGVPSCTLFCSALLACMSCRQASPPNASPKPYMDWPEVQAALESNPRRLCDGSLFKPAATDMTACITAFRCRRALDAACRRIVMGMDASTPDDGSAVPSDDVFANENRRVADCVVRLAQEWLPPDAGCSALSMKIFPAYEARGLGSDARQP